MSSSRLSHMQVKIGSYPASGKVTKDFVFIFAEIFSRRQRGMRLAEIFLRQCLDWNERNSIRKRHGQSKATLGSSKEHQKGRACGKTKKNSEAFTEKDTASARATSRESQKVTTLNVVVTNCGKFETRGFSSFQKSRPSEVILFRLMSPPESV
jgi:hypothetical protein